MLSRFERAVERLVEGSVAGLFRLRVQPAEIGRRLERAMLDGRTASVGAMLAPNDFEARLHPDDAAIFADWEDALNRELASWLAEIAFSRGLTTVGAIRVRMVADPHVSRRSVRATARFEPPGNDEPLERPRSLRLMPLETGLAPFRLVGASPKSVGRDEGNDLLLGRPDISRRHARIERDGSGWRVVDLRSTNGTWVNGKRVEAAPISEGDEVAFGGLRFAVGPE
jgi:hypothetical protein